MQASTSYVAQPQVRPPRPCALDMRRPDLGAPCPAPHRRRQGRAAVSSGDTTGGWAGAGDLDDWAFLDEEEQDLEAELDELEDSEASHRGEGGVESGSRVGGGRGLRGRAANSRAELGC
jgi:hypothetical protein